MKKPPQIDLSKVKIGQRVKLRDGKITTFGGKSGVKNHPYKAGKSGSTYSTHIRDGHFWMSGKSDLDIIQILPLPKKKAVKKATPLDKAAFNIQKHKGDKQTIRAAIKLLEGLLK